MHRNWIGVRASAVLAIVGSLALLVLGFVTLAGTLLAPPPRGPAAPPFPLATIGIVSAVLFTSLSAWGIWTAIALFRRRRWARVSFVIFAALLTMMSLCAFAAMLFTPLPAQPGVSQRMMDSARWGIASFYAVLAAIGVWWLVLFNLKSTGEYFGQAGATEPGARPLSVSVIAWYLLISGVAMGAASLIRPPGVLLGIVVTGWAGTAVYAAYAGVQLVLGRGLLRLQEWSRVGAIGYFCFGALNSALSMAPPGLQARMQIMQREMPKLFPAGTGTQTSQPFWLYLVMGMVICVVPIWFLVRQRGAFLEAEPSERKQDY